MKLVETIPNIEQIEDEELYSDSEKMMDSSESTAGKKVYITNNIYFQIERCARIGNLVTENKDHLILFENHLRILYSYLKRFEDPIYIETIDRLKKDMFSNIDVIEFRSEKERTNAELVGLRNYLFAWFEELMSLMARKNLTTIGKARVGEITPGEGDIDGGEKTEPKKD